MLLLLESGRRGRVVVLPEPESGMALRDSWASTLSWRPKESLCGLTGCCASTTRVESSGGGGENRDAGCAEATQGSVGAS